MGITYADLRLANDARDDLEEMDASAVVDTGALHLCIPEHVALQLQLKTRSQREVQTADGKSHMADYVSPVRISMLGRECVTGALVIGNQVLLGAIPLEDMDLIILDSSVERAGVCGFAGAWQGATTRNGHSIPRSCNTAMRPQNRAIQSVALSPYG
jgi:clan AA aspartic protease